MEMNERLALNEEKLMKTQQELMELKTKNIELEREVSFLKNPPFFHVCGSQGSLNISSQTITYSRLLYTSSNIEGAGLDISTGVLTGPYPGSYTATWSLHETNNAGEHAVSIYLRINGQNIQQSWHYSEYTGSSGRVDDQGRYY